MPVFRVTWNFQENTGANFQEVYYRNAGTATEAASTTAGLATARVAMNHPLTTLVSLRSAQVDASRVTGFAKYGYPGTMDPASEPVPAGLAAVILLGGTTSGSRRIWLRGLSDFLIHRNPTSGVDAPTVAFTDKLATWFTALNANGYGLRQVSPQTPGPLANLKVITVDGSAKKGYSDVTLSAAPGYPFPSRVIIGGASKKDLPALNGRWSLMQAPAGAVIRIPYQTPEGLVIDGGNTHCRQEVYQAVNVFLPSACGFGYYGTRATHVPLSHSRGARRAARIRTSL